MDLPASSISIRILAGIGATLTVLTGLTAGPPSPLAAQQYVVDDAQIVDEGACHVEAWHGRRASWILPACQAVSNLEIAAGVGFVDEGAGVRETEYAIEAKTLLRPLLPNDWGVGLVVGVGPNPSAAPDQRRFGDAYAFVPASLSLRDDQVILHGNLGWNWDRQGDDDDGTGSPRESHHLTWGARADHSLSPHLSLIGELSGEDDDRPEYQAGFRIHLPEAGVEIDVSWGESTATGARGAGLTLGAQFVSGRIF